MRLARCRLPSFTGALSEQKKMAWFGALLAQEADSGSSLTAESDAERQTSRPSSLTDTTGLSTSPSTIRAVQW